MKHNNDLLAMIGKEVEGVVPHKEDDEAKSVRYWTEYRAEIMQQLLAGNIEVPQGRTADQVVDAHVARIRNMCEMFGDGLPLSRKIIPPAGDSADAIFPTAFQSNRMH